MGVGTVFRSPDGNNSTSDTALCGVQTESSQQLRREGQVWVLEKEARELGCKNRGLLFHPDSS